MTSTGSGPGGVPRLLNSVLIVDASPGAGGVSGGFSFVSALSNELSRAGHVLVPAATFRAAKAVVASDSGQGLSAVVVALPPSDYEEREREHFAGGGGSSAGSVYGQGTITRSRTNPGGDFYPTVPIAPGSSVPSHVPLNVPTGSSSLSWSVPSAPERPRSTSPSRYSDTDSRTSTLRGAYGNDTPVLGVVSDALAATHLGGAGAIPPPVTRRRGLELAEDLVRVVRAKINADIPIAVLADQDDEDDGNGANSEEGLPDWVSDLTSEIVFKAEQSASHGRC